MTKRENNRQFNSERRNNSIDYDSTRSTEISSKLNHLKLELLTRKAFYSNDNETFSFSPKSKQKENFIFKIKSIDETNFYQLSENPIIKKKTQSHRKEILNLLNHDNNLNKKKLTDERPKVRNIMNSGSICII